VPGEITALPGWLARASRMFRLDTVCVESSAGSAVATNRGDRSGDKPPGATPSGTPWSDGAVAHAFNNKASTAPVSGRMLVLLMNESALYTFIAAARE
jgi:hypothetical protein